MINSSRGIKGFFPKGAACWALDGTPSGLADQYGNGNNLTPLATATPYPVIQSDAGHSGYNFTGIATESLTASDSVSLRPTEFTVICHVRHGQNTGAGQVYLSKMRNGTIAFSYILGRQITTDLIALTIFDSANRSAVGTYKAINGKTDIIIGTYSQINSRVRLFVNGMFIDETATVGNIAYGAFPLRIGNYTSGTFGAHGIIGASGVLNFEATSSQVADYYRYETETSRKYWIM